MARRGRSAPRSMTSRWREEEVPAAEEEVNEEEEGEVEEGGEAEEEGIRREGCEPARRKRRERVRDALKALTACVKPASGMPVN